MDIELTAKQLENQSKFRAFVDFELAPRAGEYDEAGQFPKEIIDSIASSNYLGALIPIDYGGLALDMISFGILNEAFGRVCGSARSLITVHSMVSLSILRWGNEEQKSKWLAKLSAGELIGAFALTEPDSGSDANSLQTEAAYSNNSYVLNGSKKWITFGQIADIFLLFAKVNGLTTAFIVHKDSPGLTINPLQPLSGCRASMLAELHLENCRIPKSNMLGKPGIGWRYIANMALHNGRYSVAWGCVGLSQACLEASLDYVKKRHQFGVALKEHQLIKEMITNMVVRLEASRLLCYRAGFLQDIKDPRAITATTIAKYHSSQAAVYISSNAVQIHGANGFSTSLPLQRHWRDSKIMEIIEGSTQIQQLIIADAYLG